MGFSDWKWIGQTEYFHQSDRRSNEGEHSLTVDDSRSVSEKNMVVLEQSIEDSPTEAQLRTSFHSINDGHESSFGATFRWQNENNFYSVDGRSLMSDGSGGDKIGLYKEVDGPGKTIDKIYQNNSVNTSGEWYQFRCTVFKSDRGLHFRPEYRKSDDQEWTRYNDDDDLIDPDPDLQSGGGVGMAFYNASGVQGSVDARSYFDDTRVYYKSD